MRKKRYSAIAMCGVFLLVAAMSTSVVSGTRVTKEAASCEGWNTSEYFKTVTVDDVVKGLDAGADPESLNKYGLTPLHRAAAWNKNPAILAALLAAGADLEARNKYGLTPLHWAAAWNKNPAILAALLAAGADPKARDKEGRTPWDRIQNNHALKGTDVYWRLNDARF